MLLVNHLPPGLRVPAEWQSAPVYIEEIEAAGERYFHLTKGSKVSFPVSNRDACYLELLRETVHELICGW